MIGLKTAKIVGTANETTWSQVHVFRPQPEEPKLQTHGELMAALAFKAKEEGIGVSSFGAEVIQRLQELYYSNEHSSVLKKLEQTLESLAAEFLDKIDLEAAIAVVWTSPAAKTYGYIGRNGSSQCWLRREEALASLLTDEAAGVTVMSGELQPGDRLVLGTSEFNKIVSVSQLKPVLAGENLEEVRESLAALVHGQEENSLAAAVIVEIDKTPLRPASRRDSAEQAEAEGAEESKIGAVRNWLKKMVERWKTARNVEIHVRPERGRQQKTAATAAVVLLIVFGVSVILAGNKRRQNRQQAEYQAVLEEVKYRYQEAEELVKLNPLRAKSLLTDSNKRIQEYREKSKKELSGELKELSEKIEIALGQTQREYQIDSAQEWFDFDLVKDGFRASDWEIEGKKLAVWDSETKTLVEIDLEKKASRVVIGAEKIKAGEVVALTEGRGMVVSEVENLVTVVDTEEGEVVAEVPGEDWGKISDAVGFGSNLYLLDQTSQGQIWKYLGVASGLSGKREYLKGDKFDLSEAVSLVIDGSVWVLFSDATIVKYTQGVKDAFVVAGLDRDFEEPVKLFTSPEVDNLYILDRRQTRVVVISKTGEYQAQYIWPGLAGVKDLVVSEELKKMFLLTGEKIFTIDLK